MSNPPSAHQHFSITTPQHPQSTTQKKHLLHPQSKMKTTILPSAMALLATATARNCTPSLYYCASTLLEIGKCIFGKTEHVKTKRKEQANMPRKSEITMPISCSTVLAVQMVILVRPGNAVAVSMVGRGRTIIASRRFLGTVREAWGDGI